MAVYICFTIVDGIKSIYLVFTNRKKAERFMQKHTHLYMEVWEAIT